MPDKNEALEEIHQIRRAADQGDCDARYTLAAYYEHAAGGRQDMEQAAYWYRQAALQVIRLRLKNAAIWALI